MKALARDLKAKERLLNKIQAELKQRYTAMEFKLIDEFLTIFGAHLHIEDWVSREVSDIAGCVASLWFALKHVKQTCFVRVFNPNLDEDQWLCNGSVIVVRQVDMPFLVDSLRLELNRRSIPVHIIKSTLLNVCRDDQQGIVAVRGVSPQTRTSESGTWQQEAVIFIETGMITDPEEMTLVQTALRGVLADVHTVVGDYQPMQQAVAEVRQNLEYAKDKVAAAECQAFLDWLVNSHFTFLGFGRYALVGSKSEIKLQENTTARLGLLRKKHSGDEVGETVDGAGFFYQGDDIVAFSKSASRSTVHRPVHPDYIVIKRFGEKGQVVGEVRLLGLFTYAVYSISPLDIPIIRDKVAQVMVRSGLTSVSHDGKNLIRVIESFPRDELFQSDVNTLYETVSGVARISERRVVKLFARKDVFGKFFNCVVYVPRDIYNTRIRMKIEGLIAEAIQSQEFDSTTQFSESLLARAYMVFRLADNAEINIDTEVLERAVIDITRGWDDRFETALIEAFGEAKGLKYHRLYATAFGSSYQENFDARATVKDIDMFEALVEPRDIAMHLFHPVGTADSRLRFKVMQLHEPLELSDVIPILEHLGLRVHGEHPYKIERFDGATVWLHDFTLVFSLPVNVDVSSVSKLFEQAFDAIWHKHTESDAFNRLVLGARLNWREVAMLRAYSGYMKQTAFNFSADYIADTLANQLEITRNLVALFKTFFDPRVSDASKSGARTERLKEKILASLDAIENLNEDKILRRYFDLINGTLRTNFFQRDASDNEKSYISFKFSPRDIADIPEPRPKYEIYVYSPRFEGVHLRAAKVARGGLRWSDRVQDYRTEVLGLVKAQQVKNAVIVPSGAKGGFVAKKLNANYSRDDMMAEGIECYRLFIRGLLDLTDNYLEGKLVRPNQVTCRDDDDPYLVVAADKGTATFSDIANAISIEYQHWLGDAFASGGSHGYDHKKMGITAKGAWVSVQRHFREIGKDIQQEAFSVVGIGDMSGDVFGNGMLLSPHIQLVAAFNHQHIFIDPTPNPQSSYTERLRLFELPRSGWGDYDLKLISPGGGIFPRSAKSIILSAEAQVALGVDREKWAPTDLISAILCAPVDLLWNGGIGTYVKSTLESHADVGDKSNDALRVNGNELRCKVIGEGGNLGVTQLGRTEYALQGGACNTDFIDNSAGVDCSDHEVNIKILLDEMIAAGDLTSKQRNRLLVEMTDSVAQLVLHNNYQQTFALSLAQFQAASRADEYRRFISYLEEQGLLKRKLEFLPGDDQLAERSLKGQVLTRPELAVLLSYSKVMLKEVFIQQNIAQVSYLKGYVETAFPALLIKKYREQIYSHRLLAEIVATQTANDLINCLGITAVHRLSLTTGASFKQIAVAFSLVKDIFAIKDFQAYVASLDNKVPAVFQAEIMTNMIRRLRRGTRWFLANRKEQLIPEEEITVFRSGILRVNTCMGEVLVNGALNNWVARCEQYQQKNLDLEWVQQLAMPDNLFSGLSVVEVAGATQTDVMDAAMIFYTLYDHLEIEWFATQISEVKVGNYWQALARESFLDELEAKMRYLVQAVISIDTRQAPEARIALWLEQNEGRVQRWHSVVREVQGAKAVDYAMFSVAIKELNDLVPKTL